MFIVIRQANRNMPLLGIHYVKIRAAGVDPKLAKYFCKFLLSSVSVEIEYVIGRERGNVTDGGSTTRGDLVESLSSGVKAHP